MTKLLLAVLAACGAAAFAEDILIRGAAIYPVSGAPMENASLLIRDGKIAEIGAKITVPKTTRVIDGKGLRAYPGMIDSDTEIGLSEIGAVRETNDVAELGDFKPQLRAAVAVNPSSEHIPVIRANGITAAIVRPSGGILRGQAALMHLDGWTWEEMAILRSAAMVMAFPTLSMTAPRQGAAGYQQAKKNLDAQLKQLDEYFASARHYQKARTAGARTDLGLEAMLPVLDRKLPLLVSATREREIRQAIEWATRQGVRLVLSGVRKPGEALAMMKARDVAVILGPTLALPLDEDDAYDAAFTLPAELLRAGVKFAFGSGGNQFSRNLPYQAAQAVAFGLPYDEALKSVTLYPAQIWGVDSTIGSLEVGKSADIMLIDGDPLEIRSEVKRLFIQGKEVDLESRHTRLYKRYMARP